MDNATQIRAAPESAQRQSRVLSLDEVESPIIRDGVSYWRRLRGERRFPARADMSPADIRALLRHTVLLRVADGGSDYDYRIVGDAHVTAYGFSMQGKKLSELDGFAPGHGAVLKRLYDRVVRRREPYALRGWLERGGGQVQYIFSESVFMPLGPDDDVVDHVLNFSVYIPHDLRG